MQRLGSEMRFQFVRERITLFTGLEYSKASTFMPI